MGEEPLVESTSGRRQPLIEQGEALLRLLDENHVLITAAFWFLDPESRTWKYILASPNVTTQGPLQVYRNVQQYLGQVNAQRPRNAFQRFLGQGELTLQDIAVVSPHDPRVNLLRVAMKTGPTDISGIRFTADTINNTFIDDAYIYRNV